MRASESRATKSFAEAAPEDLDQASSFRRYLRCEVKCSRCCRRMQYAGSPATRVGGNESRLRGESTAEELPNRRLARYTIRTRRSHQRRKRSNVRSGSNWGRVRLRRSYESNRAALL